MILFRALVIIILIFIISDAYSFIFNRLYPVCDDVVIHQPNNIDSKLNYKLDIKSKANYNMNSSNLLAQKYSELAGEINDEIGELSCVEVKVKKKDENLKPNGKLRSLPSWEDF